MWIYIYICILYNYSKYAAIVYSDRDRKQACICYIYILYIWYIVITTVYMVYINYRDSKNTTGYNLVVKSVIPGSID